MLSSKHVNAWVSAFISVKVAEKLMVQLLTFVKSESKVNSMSKYLTHKKGLAAFHELYLGCYINKAAVNVSVCFETF